MKRKNFLSVTALVFAIVAIVHLLRVLNGWEVAFGNTYIPMWASYAGIVLAGYLSYWGHKFSKGE